MRWFRMTLLAAKQVWRHPVRSMLTVLGVATGMFLFVTVETMNQALVDATQVQAEDTVLVVYRENRFCPFTSRLPDHYLNRIEDIPGVRAVTPIKVVVNNCGTSLDVVTFRGVAEDRFADFARDRLEIVEGNLASWYNRGDAALVGAVLARRRGIKVGDSFSAAGVTVQVAGIIASAEPQDHNVAYVHLPFLQQTARGGLGEVTQFNVHVDQPANLETVATAIDDTFRHDQDPTHTRPEKAFVAATAKDLVTMIGFTRWVGLGAIVAVIALVANTIFLAIRTRIRDFAVLQTLGYGPTSIMQLVLVEGVVLGLCGGLCGVGAAWGFLYLGGYSLSAEGLSIVFEPRAMVMGIGVLTALGLGLLAAMLPAVRVARQSLVNSLRMV